MRRFTRLLSMVAWITLALAGGGRAQDDPGFVARLIQDSLSGPGREVRVTGFSGALSSQARMERLTIADAQGIWLILENAELDWTRSALLRGRLSVDKLGAERLEILRAPVAADTGVAAPSAEASGFALPDLPVSVAVNAFSIGTVVLGAPLIGQAATVSLDGAVTLADGEGAGQLSLDRIDGPEGRIGLSIGFDNATRVLSVQGDVREAAGGLIGTLLKIPGAPALGLEISGEGPLSDFTARMALASDGEQRVSGQVALRGTDAGDTRFFAQLGGDVATLVAPEYRDFFGPDVALTAEGRRASTGALDLEGFDLSARSLSLNGSLSVGTSGLPTAFQLTGVLRDPQGDRVRLPVAAEVTVDGVTLTAIFDADRGDSWGLDLATTGVAAEGYSAGQITLNGGGTISSETGAQAVTANLTFGITSLAGAAPELAEAIGTALRGNVDLTWSEGAPLTLNRLSFGGSDYGLSGAGSVSFADRTVRVDGQATVSAQDLARFSGLAGRPLTGAAEIALAGEADLLGGIFDATLEVDAQDLSLGQEIADRMLDGPVRLSAAMRRDTAGTTLDRFDLTSPGVTASGQGTLGPVGSALTLTSTLTDVGLIAPQYSGALTVEGSVSEPRADLFGVEVSLVGPYGLTGTVAGELGAAASEAVTLDLSLPDIEPLVPEHTGPVRVRGTGRGTPDGQWQVDLDVDGPYHAQVALQGLVGDGRSDLRLDVGLPDIAPLAPGYTGALALNGTAAETGEGRWLVDLEADGPYASAARIKGPVGDGRAELDLFLGLQDIAAVVPGISGPLQLDGSAAQTADARWRVELDAGGPWRSTARVSGLVGATGTAVEVTAALPDVSAVAPGVTGAARVTASVAQDPDGAWRIDGEGTGPFASSVGASARIAPQDIDISATVALPDLGAVVPQLRGAARIAMRARRGGDGVWQIAADGTGPYRSTLDATGQYKPGESTVTLLAALPDIGPLAPGLSGPLRLNATVTEAAAQAWTVTAEAVGPYRSTAAITGRVASGASALDFRLAVPNIAPLAPGLSGAVQATGTARETASGYAVDLTSQGPGSAQAQIGGTVATDFKTLNLSARGTAPLGLANQILAPRQVDGTLSFDLAVNGPPALSSVRGTASTRGALFAEPTLGQTVRNIDATVTLSGATAQVDVSAAPGKGGRVTVTGPVRLGQGGTSLDLDVRLAGVVIEDPTLYRTVLDGLLRVSGPVTGGGRISGGINVGATEISIPSGGLGFGGSIPQMTHINEPGAVRLTRVRARAVDEGNGSGGDGGQGGGFGLDIRISAPNQVFIRGRGLDLELGGDMRVGGTTSSPVPVGGIQVIRGRLSLLGKRLEFSDEGQVTLSGDLTPFLDLIATSQADDIVIVITITGPVDAPVFSFTSEPTLPEDEVIARLLFGRGVTSLSPFQAAQLAASIAELTGRGGGLLSGFRSGLGVDDLDVTTDEEGQTEVTVGKYLSENIYTDVTASGDGTTTIRLNIDITDDVKISGQTGTDGDTSIGIYYERDY